MRIPSFVAASITALWLGACQPAAGPAPVPGQIDQAGAPVVKVDAFNITQPMLDASTRYFPPQQLESAKKNGQFDRLLDQLAMGEVFYHKAVDQKLYEDPAVQAVIAMRVREAMANEYVYREAQKRVSQEAVQKYYDERKVQYGRPQLKASHVLVKEEVLANDLKTQIDGGASLPDLAKQYSTDKSNSANGGDLGWFNEGTMVKEFNDAAFAAEKGSIIGPIQTRFGYHIIKVEDKRDATPLEEVRPQIEAALRQEAIDAIRKETKDAMKVEKNVPDIAPAPEGGPGGPGGLGGMGGRPRPPAGHPGMPPGGMPPGMGGPPGGPPGARPMQMPPGAPPAGAPPAGAPPAAPAAPPAGN